jgi:hypothetical protein
MSSVNCKQGTDTDSDDYSNFPPKMHMSTLIKSFGQLQAAAANIRESTTGAGHAINGALSEIDWKSIGNNVRDATVDVAARVAETYDLTEQTLRSIQWDNVGPEAAKAIKDNRRMLFVAGGIAAGAATGGLLMGLVLGAAGFSSIGPVAGTKEFPRPF